MIRIGDEIEGLVLSSDEPPKSAKLKFEVTELQSMCRCDAFYIWHSSVDGREFNVVAACRDVEDRVKTVSGVDADMSTVFEGPIVVFGVDADGQSRSLTDDEKEYLMDRVGMVCANEGERPYNAHVLMDVSIINP